MRAGANAVRQITRVRELIAAALARPEAFQLTPSLVCELHGLVLAGESDAGQLRSREVTIDGSPQEPPPAALVPALVAELCRDVNESGAEPVTRAVFALWRLCWIHPFADGNGRTARAVAYLVLCVGLEQEPPGPVTAFERMTEKRLRYHTGLEAADRAFLEDLLLDQIEQR